MILSKGNALVVRVPKSGEPETDVTQNLHDMERIHMLSVLEKTGWRVSGKGGAAEALGLKRTTLQAKMKKLGIKRPNK
jgi:transcriptional regulator with GAF, ATPase, and Fis domain